MCVLVTRCRSSVRMSTSCVDVLPPAAHVPVIAASALCHEYRAAGSSAMFDCHLWIHWVLVFSGCSPGSAMLGLDFVVVLVLPTQLRVNMTFDIRDETVPFFLRLIDPKITYTLGLSRKVQVIEALQVRRRVLSEPRSP